MFRTLPALSPVRSVRTHASVLAACAVLALAACGGGGGDGDSSVGGGGSSGPTEPGPTGPAPVASVAVTPATVALTVGGTATLQATTRAADGGTLTGRAVTWSSADPAVAVVSASGAVTAVAPGGTTITATSEGRSGTATVTVTPRPVDAVTLSLDADTLEVGQTRALDVVVTAADGTVLTDRTVTWSSAAPAVATVTDGTVTAVAPGDAPITATVEGRSATATITVVPVPVAGLDVSADSVALFVGAEATVTATPRSATGDALPRPVTWTSRDPAVATVSTTAADGTAAAAVAATITAVAPGTTELVASSEGVEATVTVEVSRVPVAAVTVSPATDTLIVGTAGALTATVRDADGNVLADRTVAWQSLSPEVAAVDLDGVVTAIAPGTADVTATAEGRSATATITVLPVPVAALAVSPDSVALIVGAQATVSATPRSAAGDALERPVTWTSRDPAVASVSVAAADGSDAATVAAIVTAIAPGTAELVATSEGVEATVTVEVSRVPVAVVSVSPAADTLTVGGSESLAATVRDVDGNVLIDRTVTWRSADPAVASVDATTGLVTAVAPGSTSIIASSEGVEDQATIVVQPPFAVSDDRRLIAPGYEQTCAIGADDNTYCWGNQAYGAVGNGVVAGMIDIQFSATRVNGAQQFTSLAVGYRHMCGLEANGAAWCWGRANLGQRGDGAQGDVGTPQPVAGGHAFVQIAGHWNTTCGVTAAGEAWCWGSNANGALGANASGTGSTTPVRVAGGHTFRQLAASNNSVCALRDDGAPFCWGSNSGGALGIGSVGGSRAAPVEVEGGHRFVQLTGGFGHFCGRTLEGAVWCWGFNSYGQLGDGTQVNRATPVLANGGATYARITSADVNTCGLSPDGVAFCWGGGSGGVLGDGNTQSSLSNFSLTPKPVQGGLLFEEVTAGSQSVCGITAAAQVYCWGSNGYGTIGDGTQINRGVPTAVVGLP